MESKFHCSYSGLSSVMSYTLDIDRIIEMAWEDRTPFEAIEYQFGIKENDGGKELRVEKPNMVRHQNQQDLKVKIKNKN